MIYCIDTSALIDLDRDYSLDVFPSLWEKHSVGLVEERRLVATEEIKTELQKQDDDLYRWLKNHCKQMFYPTTSPVMAKVGEILSQYKNLVNPEKPDKNHADPVRNSSRAGSSKSLQKCFQYGGDHGHHSRKIHPQPKRPQNARHM